MFSNIDAFGRQLLTAIYLIVCTIIAARICFGHDSRRVKEMTILGILLLVVGIQYYHLLDVVTFVPATRFYVYDSGIRRGDCLRSGKGGKRVKASNETYDFNPCFCDLSIATCYSKATGKEITGPCPLDGTAKCLTANGSKIHLHLSAKRNCEGGQGPACTKDQPCYPCDLQNVVNFQTSRCRTCSTDFTGKCNFIPDVGPYCFEKINSKKVVPCQKCCTENTQLIIQNGTCY